MSNLVKSFLQDSAFYTITSFISKITNVLLLPFYLQLLSKENFGLYDYLIVSLTILTIIFTLQIDQAFGRYYSSTGNSLKKKSIYTTGLIYYVIIFLIISVSVWLNSEFIASTLFNNAEYSNRSIQFISPYILFNHILIYNLSAFRWSAKSKLYSIIVSSMAILQAVIIIYFLLNGYAVLSIFIGLSVVSVFFAIITLFLLRDNFRIKTFSLFILKRLMQFGLPLVPAAVSIYFLQYVDRYMIVNMLGLESLGLYSVGIRISTVIMLVFSGFQMAWGPFIFANYKNPAIHLILTKTFVTLMISTLLLTVSFTLFSPELLFLIANPVYENAYIYVPYLMFTSFLFLISGYFSIGFSIAKNNWPKVYINVTAFILNIVLNYILISYLQIEGAAASTLISIIFLTVVSLQWSCKFYPMQFQLKKLIPLISMSLAIIIVSRLYFNSQVSGLIILYKMSCIVVLLLLIYFSRLVSLKNLKEILKKEPNTQLS